jgi:hypothetical protein
MSMASHGNNIFAIYKKCRKLSQKIKPYDKVQNNVANADPDSAQQK